MSLTRTTLLSPILRLSLSAPSRNTHFLSSVPLKKRGVEGELPKDYFEGKKPLVLYFSAGWCPSCRVLTPKLMKFHNKVKDQGLEIVWISRDKTEEDLEEYYGKKLPPIPYIPFGNENIRGFLQKYDVKTIPALRLVNENGDVISDEIRNDVEEKWKKDPQGLIEKWQKMY